MINSWEDIEYLNNKKPIGEGAFSKVYKVKLKNDKKVYAWKEIDITTLSKGDRSNLKEEINIHKNINHEYIIKFYDVLQIFNHVYILLEYCELGSLFYYINEKNGMPEQIALKFFYQISIAIEFLHKKNIIHRDIKPENVWITKDYKAKLCDFGWSTILKNNIKNSICGTYEYMSPEIVLEKNYDYKIDIWAMGILLFELLHGYPPYKATNLFEIKEAIMQNDLEIKKEISKTSNKMIKKLLKLNYKNRITSSEIFKQKSYCDYKIFVNGKLSDSDIRYLRLNINEDSINKKEESSILKYNKKIQSITVEDIEKYINKLEVMEKPKVQENITKINLSNQNNTNFKKSKNKNFDKNVSIKNNNTSDKNINTYNTEKVKIYNNINNNKIKDVKKISQNINLNNIKNNNDNIGIVKNNDLKSNYTSNLKSNYTSVNNLNNNKNTEYKNWNSNQQNNHIKRVEYNYWNKNSTLRVENNIKNPNKNENMFIKKSNNKAEVTTNSNLIQFKTNKNPTYQNIINKNNLLTTHEGKLIIKSDSKINFNKNYDKKHTNISKLPLNKLEIENNWNYKKHFSTKNFSPKKIKKEDINEKENNIYQSTQFKDSINTNKIIEKRTSLNKNRSLKNFINNDDKNQIVYKYTIIEKLNGDIIKKYNDGSEILVSSRNLKNNN